MRVVVFATLALLAEPFAWTQPAEAGPYCKDYSRCSQAVANWCNGSHPKADGDGDGIPCENVCPSLQVVEEEKRRIGCRR